MDDHQNTWQGEERRSLSHIEVKLDEITTCIASIKQAFPDGDVIGHRKYHEAKIKAAVAEEEFWKDLKLDIAKKGAWGLIVILIGLVLLGISVKLGAVAKVV
ncbi:MAG: hypothetical protein Q8S71_03690 [Hydrogenophaga sp.]|nr:hypothetical protein [Hydrogenophaga sp.]